MGWVLLFLVIIVIVAPVAGRFMAAFPNPLTIGIFLVVILSVVVVFAREVNR